MNTKKNRAAAWLVVGVVLLAGAGAASAQETERAKVAFPFVVGQEVLPAGDYQVFTSDEDPGLLQIVSEDGRHSVFFAVQGSDTSDRWGDPEFTFVNIGGRYYLHTIDTGTGSVREVVLPEPVERAIRAAKAEK
jgi:hypothetical protein